MACHEPIALCLRLHYAFHLPGAKVSNDGRQVRADCPACGAERALTISPGDRQWTKWNCFGGCGRAALRAAMRRHGVPDRCLPRGIEAWELVEAEITTAAASGERPKETLLRLLALARGYRRWPRGARLTELAAAAGVSRRGAYRARARPLVPLSPGTSSTYSAQRGPVKNPQARSAFRAGEVVPPMAQVPPVAQPEVPPVAQPGEEQE